MSTKGRLEDRRSASNSAEGDRLIAVILAAGFKKAIAHAESLPTALLPIAGTPLLDLILEKLCDVDGLDRVILLVNEVDAPAFEQWQRTAADAGPLKVELVHNEIDSANKMRGAAGDLQYVLEKVLGCDNRADVLVIGGDNYFEFSLREFCAQFRKKRCLQVAVSEVGSSALKQRFGAVRLEKGHIVEFIEKPNEPQTGIAGTLCHLLPSVVLDDLKRFVNKAEEPASLGAFLEERVKCGQQPIVAFEFDGRWSDVGTLAQYRDLNQSMASKRIQEPGFYYVTEAVILFADIVGSTTIAEFLSDRDYDEFLTEFQRIAGRLISETLSKFEFSGEDLLFTECAVRGDEAFLILYTKDPERDARCALEFAIKLKRKWLLSAFNRRRRGRSFYDVGIGIHYGSIVLRDREERPDGSGGDGRAKPEGYAISLTKRIEGYSREGQLSKIMLSQRFCALAGLPSSIKLHDHARAALKGIYGSASIRELEVHGDIEDPEAIDKIGPHQVDDCEAALESSKHDLWLLLMVARYYYDAEEYQRAQKYYREAVERFPQSPVGSLFLGRSMYRLQHFEEACRHLKKACELQPDSARANSFLAVALRRQRQYQDAIYHHEQALKADSPSVFEANAFAYTLAEAHDAKVPATDLNRARELLTTARARVADFSRAAPLLDHTDARIALAEGDWLAALARLEDVVRDIQKDGDMARHKKREKLGEAHFHLGMAYARLKKRPPALDFLKRANIEPLLKGSDSYYWKRELLEEIKHLEGLTGAE